MLLDQLPGDLIIPVGLAVQASCAIGVFLARGWRSLLVFAALLPVFLLLPFILSSGHGLGFFLDGIIILPVLVSAAMIAPRFRKPKP